MTTASSWSRRALLAGGFAALGAGCASVGSPTGSSARRAPRSGPWPAERARAWRAQVGWLVGANYAPRYAINQLEMWQADTFDLAQIDQELGWAQALGFNVMRVYLHDILYRTDRAGLFRRMNDYLAVSDKHGIKTIFVLMDDVWHPVPRAGRQPEPLPGIHNSGWVQSPGREVLGDFSRHDELKPYVQDTLRAFADDRRVIAWELYNEPANLNASAYGPKGRFPLELPNKEPYSLALLVKAFEWAWEVNPAQPIFISAWKGGGGGWAAFVDEKTGGFVGWDRVDATDRLAFAMSDFIGFHSYEPNDTFIKEVAVLKGLFPDVPIVCTEYMRRPENTFSALLPVLKENDIGAIHWGFVSGKSQTIHAWPTWQTPDVGEPKIWFHDVLRQDGAPYDPAEAALIRKITGAAERGMAR